MHVGGIDAVSCQHLPVLMTQLLQKHGRWQEDRRKDVWHGSEKNSSMYVVGTDIMAAFDVARPKHIAKNIDGWSTAAYNVKWEA